MIDSAPNENRTAQDPIEFTEEAIHEDQIGFGDSKTARRMLLSTKKKKNGGRNTSSKKKKDEGVVQQQQQLQQTLWRLPAKQNPDQVYVHASLESPDALGKDLMDEGLLSQVDYIAHGNEKASSFLASANDIDQRFDGFLRSFQSPEKIAHSGISWLGKNCADNAPKMKVLKEVSNHFPVFSIGECRETRTNR